MSVLGRKKHKSTMIVESTEIPLSEDANKVRGKLPAPPLQNIPSLPSGRNEKILAIRQQLAESTYELDKRLDVVLERILVAVTN